MTEQLFVEITGTIPGGAGAIALFTPSQWLNDAPDELLIPPGPVRVILTSNDDGSGSLPAGISLLAEDSPGPVPSGWTWSAAFSGIDGVAAYGFSFLLQYANGASQDITALAHTEPASPVLPYLTLPGGTPTAGAVPAAAGYGQASNWTVLDAADVGALPLSGGQMTGALAPAVADVSDAATVTINAAAGNDADLTLTQDTLLETPLNPVDGQKLLLRVAQGAGAPWSLSYSDAWLFTTGLPAPALSQSEGDVDLLGWRYDAGLGGWLFLGSVTGFAS